MKQDNKSHNPLVIMGRNLFRAFMRSIMASLMDSDDEKAGDMGGVVVVVADESSVESFNEDDVVVGFPNKQLTPITRISQKRGGGFVRFDSGAVVKSNPRTLEKTENIPRNRQKFPAR